MEDPLPAVSLFLLVLASGFFSFSGAALGMARKPRLRIKAAASGRGLAEAAETPGPLIFSLRIWNLLTRLAAGALGVLCFPGRILPSLAILALAFTVLSELLPRLIAQLDPEGFFLALSPLLLVLALPWKVFYLPVSALPLFRKHRKPREEEEFRMALEEGEKTGAVGSDERSMVEGVLYLGDRPVGAFMTHRSDTEWLDIEADREEVRNKALNFRAQGFFPVVRGTQDNIAGIVSVQDILIALLEDSWQGLRGIMKKPRFIPETLSAIKAFEAFKREAEDCLCVMDEYGGFAGSLRIRDLIEEIVGELTPSPAEEAVLLQENGSWLVDGSVSVDELAETPGLEELGAETPRDYHTLAGFILKLAGDIPRTGEGFTWKQFRFKVLDLDGNRIDKVLISTN
ncbi:MAG: hemolysin family protein [Treponema sp.]|jgi:putative hemolysin|nr:hemolysin family protein [Treponema sp.]